MAFTVRSPQCQYFKQGQNSPLDPAGRAAPSKNTTTHLDDNNNNNNNAKVSNNNFFLYIEHNVL